MIIVVSINQMITSTFDQGKVRSSWCKPLKIQASKDEEAVAFFCGGKKKQQNSEKLQDSNFWKSNAGISVNTFLTLEATGHFRRQFGIVKASGESLDSNLIIDFPSIKSNRKPFCVFFPKKTQKNKKTHRFLKTPQN